MIGIFDSGVGGLSVAREVAKVLPGYRLLYFGDTARTPYGNKSKEVIIKYAIENAEFLLGKGAKIIIVGCNTASAFALKALKEKFPDVLMFGVIEPAAKEAASYKRIGVIGTRGTVASGIYEDRIKKSNPGAEVFSKACPLFVPLVEEGWTKKPEAKTIARKYLQSLRMKSLEALVLGCTHYPFLEKVIWEKIGRKVELINSGREAARELKEFLKNNPKTDAQTERGENHEFYVSDLAPHLSQLASGWMGIPVKLQKAEIGDR